MFQPPSLSQAWTIFAFLIITINDIAAYMFGFFFGQTPLIVLSPRKTVEGYLGGGLVTIILGNDNANEGYLVFIISSGPLLYNVHMLG